MSALSDNNARHATQNFQRLIDNEKGKSHTKSSRYGHLDLPARNAVPSNVLVVGNTTLDFNILNMPI